MRLPAVFPILLFLSVSPILVMAHPLPDIPVRGSFEMDGSCTIRVEVDPRCFEPDPEQETYLTQVQLTKLFSPAEQDELKAKALALVARGVEFFFEPQGTFKPEFTWEFNTLGGGPLVKYDDIVVVTGTWRSKLPEGAQGYSIRASDPRNLAVVFENTLHGRPVERTAVLFPGEKSFTLLMDGSNAAAASAPPVITEESGQTSPKGGMSWLTAAALLVAALAALWLARVIRT